MRQAFDLTPNGIDEACNGAERAAAFLRDGAQILARSSRYGRVLQSARVAAKLWSEELRLNMPEPVFECDELGEVSLFEYARLCALVRGGRTLTEGGTEFVIPPNETNPHGLSPEEYFVADAAVLIGERVKASWPSAFRQAVEATETCKDATKRMLGFVSSLIRESGEPVHHVLFSHGGLTAFIVNEATVSGMASLSTGGFVHLVPNGSDLVAAYVDGWDGELSGVGIFEAARRKFGRSFI
jgi:broad specificity phosphatase PhoE